MTLAIEIKISPSRLFLFSSHHSSIMSLCNLSVRLWMSRHFEMLTDGQTDDVQKVITITYPEHSSGELKITL